MATATGSEVWIGAEMTISAANGVPTAAEFNTWKSASGTHEISRIGTVGEIGDSVEAVTITDLSDGRTRRVPGALDGGEISVTITQVDYTDGGQNLVRTNSNTAIKTGIVIVDPSLEDRASYHRGLVANYMESERSPSVNRGATFTIYRNEAEVAFDPTS